MAGTCAVLESPRIDVAGSDREHVAGRSRLDAVAGAGIAQRGAEPRHLAVERGCRVDGLVVAPELLGDPVDGDDMAWTDKQHRQECPEPRAVQHNFVPLVVDDRERPEYPELHRRKVTGDRHDSSRTARPSTVLA